MAESADTQSPPPAGSPTAARAVTFLVAGAFFMEMLDGTVIATALPQMGRSFGVSAVTLNIGVTAYLLALAVFIPISGWIADRFGSRPVFASAIALFTLASLLCGLSDGIGSFTAARLLQGAGGAAMVPVGRLIVLRMTPKDQLVRAIGTIVWPGLVAPVLGPPLGGFLVLHFSWRWIFFLNIPLGIAAVILAMLLVPAGGGGDRRRPLDGAGFLLSGAALVLIVYGIDALGAASLDAGASLALIGIGAILAIAAVRHFGRHPNPLLDLSPLRIPTYAVVVWGGSILRVAIGAVPFLLPLLFQIGFGLDPLTAGTLLLCVFAGNIAMKLFTTGILRRFGFRSVMLVNGTLAALAVAACALLTPQTPYWLIAPILFAGGAFRSMQFTSLSAIQFADVPPAKLRDANTLASMLQQLMLGIGVVAGAGALNLSAAWRGTARGMPDLIDFRFAFLAMGALGLLGLIGVLRLDRDAGRSISGHRG